MGYNNNNAGMHEIKHYGWNNHPGTTEGYDKYGWMLGEVVTYGLECKLMKQKRTKKARGFVPELSKIYGKCIKSNKYGYGFIDSVDNSRVTIRFSEGKSIKFSYPLMFSTGTVVLV